MAILGKEQVDMIAVFWATMPNSEKKIYFGILFDMEWGSNKMTCEKIKTVLYSKKIY